MIPSFESDTGNLPRGIHDASWDEVKARFGGTFWRQHLLEGLEEALRQFVKAGCTSVLLDGSFVTAKAEPNDYDGAWEPDGVDLDLLDEVLLDFSNSRAAMKKEIQRRNVSCQFYSGAGQGLPRVLSARSSRQAQRYRPDRSKGYQMITNDYQYRVTKAAAAKFRTALAEMKEAPPRRGVHPRLLKAEREAVESQLQDLENELTEYDLLKGSGFAHISIGSVAELGKGLVQARIAAGLSQKELAAQLHLKEQQIQRYEQTEYEKASLGRLAEVARALHVRIDHITVAATEESSRS